MPVISRLGSSAESIPCFARPPHLLLAAAPKRIPPSETDYLIALTNFELLAQSQGLGTLWNALARWTIDTLVPQLRGQLGIPADHRIGYCMSFGRPAMVYPRTVQQDRVPIIKIEKIGQAVD